MVLQRFSGIIHACFLIGMLNLSILAAAKPANAANVTEVVSPNGIKAYLIEENAVPFLAMNFHFDGGSALDPAGKEGLAYLLSGLLDEGAGKYDSQAFQSELENNAIRLSFDAERDGFSGNLQALRGTYEHAFELLRLALSEPRFDDEPVERIKSQISASIKRRETDPDYISSRSWYEAAFGDHVYARPVRGTLDSIQAITKEDLQAFVKERLSKKTLVIGVAGDINAEELGSLLDHAFAGLSELEAPEPPPAVTWPGGGTVIKELAVPQSVVTFGHLGIARQDPEFYAAFVANHILGGGGFGSRLMEEVREKRGLAYGVYSYMRDLDSAPLFMGGVATANDRVSQSIDIINHEIEAMANGEISQEELDDAKTYLTGSFPLRQTSNRSIARLLVGMQLYDLGIGFLNERNGYIEAVSLDDVKSAAARLFDPGQLLYTVVGMPEGLDDGNTQ